MGGSEWRLEIESGAPLMAGVRASRKKRGAADHRASLLTSDTLVVPDMPDR